MPMMPEALDSDNVEFERVRSLGDVKGAESEGAGGRMRTSAAGSGGY